MAKFVKNGERMTVLSLAADILSGAPLLIGDRVFVACGDGKAGEELEFYPEGVFEMTAGAAIAQGKNVKFNNTTKKWSVALADAGGATPGEPVHGICYSSAAADNDLVWIKLLS